MKKTTLEVLAKYDFIYTARDEVHVMKDDALKAMQEYADEIKNTPRVDWDNLFIDFCNWFRNKLNK